MSDEKPKRPAEPYGYEDPETPQGQRKRRKDGYEPYRDRREASHLRREDFKDGQAHPEVDEHHYGEAPKKAPPGRPSTPAVKTQR